MNLGHKDLAFVLVRKSSKGFPKDQFRKYRVETDSMVSLMSFRSLEITFSLLYIFRSEDERCFLQTIFFSK
jgi:hypothetical protein